MTDHDDFGFGGYRKGSGRLAENALARVKGDDTWTIKHKRAAKLLKLKNKLLHPFRVTRDKLRFAAWYARRVISKALSRVTSRS